MIHSDLTFGVPNLGIGIVIASWVLLSLILIHLSTLVTWRDLRRPQPGHRYSDCFLGLAFLNLDPSIHFLVLQSWILIHLSTSWSCSLESWSIYPLLLGLAQSWSTSWSCPLRLLSHKCRMLEMHCFLYRIFPVFCFNLFSQSNLLKHFHCSFPAFFFLLSSW